VIQERVADAVRYARCKNRSHNALPQPNFVPVMPSMSRKTHSSGASPSTSDAVCGPVDLIVKAMVPFPFYYCERREA